MHSTVLLIFLKLSLFIAKKWTFTLLFFMLESSYVPFASSHSNYLSYFVFLVLPLPFNPLILASLMLVMKRLCPIKGSICFSLLDLMIDSNTLFSSPGLHFHCFNSFFILCCLGFGVQVSLPYKAFDKNFSGCEVKIFVCWYLFFFC